MEGLCLNMLGMTGLAVLGSYKYLAWISAGRYAATSTNSLNPEP